MGRDTSFITDTVFLKTVEKGNFFTLYSYTDKYKTRFFISEKNSSLIKELIYRIYYNSNERNTDNRTVEENIWKGQLYQEALIENENSKKLNNIIENSYYKEEDILKIVNIINNTTKNEAKKINRSRIKPAYLVLAIVSAIIIIIESVHEFSLAKS